MNGIYDAASLLTTIVTLNQIHLILYEPVEDWDTNSNGKQGQGKRELVTRFQKNKPVVLKRTS